MLYSKDNKRLLFFLPDMNVGGMEKSFLSLIETIPKESCITLLLFQKRGGFLDQVPSNVKIIELENYLKVKPFVESPPVEVIKNCFQLGHFVIGAKHLYNYIRFKITGDGSYLFRSVDHVLNILDQEFDLSIAYAGPHNFISHYILTKTTAKKKIAWVHFDVSKIGINKITSRKQYKEFDRIHVVSEEGKVKFLSYFPEFDYKTFVFKNVIAEGLIRKQAETAPTFDDDFNGIRLLTVGRLSIEKGQELALYAADKLKQEGYNFKWYFVGDGKDRNAFEILAHELHILECVSFIGSQTNPYGYMKDTDLYVQTSRHEGYCITLAEALVFKKKIVSTDFTGAREQVDSDEKGIVVPISSTGLYDGIQKLIGNF